MADELLKHKIFVILVQIDEAHSIEWPMAIDNTFDVIQPENQKTFEDRINRVNYFVKHYNPPCDVFNVYVDGWNNEFAEIFQAWPDRHYCINKNFQIITKAEYHLEGDEEAVVIEDCTITLEKLMT